MELPDDDETSAITTTTSIYVRAERVAALNKAATRVNYENDSPKQMSAAELARYLIDNYLEVAVQQLIADYKKTISN